MDNTSPEPVIPPLPTFALTDSVERQDSATSDDRCAPIPQRIGDFTIVRVLGEGGMGTVYLAEDLRLGRKAAIKTMKRALAARPEYRMRFVREARAAAAVEHDNIVPIWQIGEAADGSPFIAMPFLQGEMLADRLKRQSIPPLGVVLKAAHDVANGLAAAHARGLIHRDIKPGNVWLEGDPRAKDLARQVRRCKILDFGLARSLQNDDVKVTASGAILGTPAFMAPEQARGEKVDHRTDLFSLGATLYLMTTGRLPFAGPTTMAVLMALGTVSPPSAHTLNPNLPQWLSDLIDRLMSKDAAGRPQSADEVATLIRQTTKDLQKPKPAFVTTDVIKPSAVAAVSLKAPKKRAAARSQPPHRSFLKTWQGRAALLTVLGLLVLAPLGWWLSAVILRVETANGTLVVEVNDAETEARIRNGKLILTGPDGKDRYTLAPGERDKKIAAGPYKIRVEGADGLTLDTPEFVLKQGDQVKVRVTLEPPRTTVKRLDTDRQAAEWVLSIGGTIAVNGEEHHIQVAADIPPEAFQLTCVDLQKNPRVNDAGLAHLKDCRSLQVLFLGGASVSDAGMVHFAGSKNLTRLDLNGAQITDAGLACFKDCKKLTYLILNGTQVSDAGVASFKDCKDLTFIGLGGTQVSDVGLAYFKNNKTLAALWVYGTHISDAGLARFKDCKSLTNLHLADTRVSDAGLISLIEHKNLTFLNLNGAKVSDVGLAHLEDCATLTELAVRGTKVTAAKIESLKKALPHCKIDWDGGVIEPAIRLDADREAAEWVLSLGGVVAVNDQDREFRAAAELPSEAFQLSRVDLQNNAQVNDEGLAHLKNCKNLTRLDLSGTQAGDAGLANFKGCNKLTALGLSGTRVSDAGLVNFKDCKNLVELWLSSTQVSDAGLANFKGCKNLISLAIGETSVSDTGLAVFKDCKDLRKFWLHGTQVSDAGLAYFKDLKSIQVLHLSGTRVSDVGLASFNDCPDLTDLWLAGTQVSDAGLAAFKDCKKLTALALAHTQVTDAGLAFFKGCKELKHLDLYNTQVSDAGLAPFKGCDDLRVLLLGGTRLGDAGLAPFKSCKDLTILALNDTQVGDGGTAYFRDCKNLTQLDLKNTKVTAAKVDELKKALPNCKIAWE